MAKKPDTHSGFLGRLVTPVGVGTEVSSFVFLLNGDEIVTYKNTNLNYPKVTVELQLCITFYYDSIA